MFLYTCIDELAFQFHQPFDSATSNTRSPSVSQHLLPLKCSSGTHLALVTGAQAQMEVPDTLHNSKGRRFLSNENFEGLSSGLP